jgi:hypothetical protein
LRAIPATDFALNRPGLNAIPPLRHNIKPNPNSIIAVKITPNVENIGEVLFIPVWQK